MTDRAGGSVAGLLLNGCDKMPAKNGAPDDFWTTAEPPEPEYWLICAGDDPARRAALDRWIKQDQFVLGKPGHLEELTLRGRAIGDEHIRDVVLFPELTNVAFIDASVTDAGLDVLRQLPNVDVVYIIECPNVTNAVCRSIRSLPKLEVLNLSKSRIGNDGVSALRALPRLTTLVLRDTAITSRALDDIAAMPLLDELDMARTRIDDEGLRYLANKKSLKHLYLDETTIGDKGIAHLKNLKWMAALTLRSTRVGDGSLQVIGTFPNMECLVLRDTRITSDGVAYLAPLTQLREVSLDGTAVDDQCVPHLEKLQSLKTMTVRRTKLSRAGIERLQAALPCFVYNDFGVKKK